MDVFQRFVRLSSWGLFGRKPDSSLWRGVVPWAEAEGVMSQPTRMTMHPADTRLFRLALLVAVGIAFWTTMIAVIGPNRVTVGIPFTPFEATFFLSF